MKTKIFKLSFAVLLCASMTSCITMQSATISDVKSTKGTEVTASAGGFSILALTAPRDISKKATQELKNKGAVGDVSTVMTVRNWVIVQYYRVTATGTTDQK